MDGSAGWCHSGSNATVGSTEIMCKQNGAAANWACTATGGAFTDYSCIGNGATATPECNAGNVALDAAECATGAGYSAAGCSNGSIP